MQAKLQEILPRLVTAYHEGLLVPFIGSGMSAGSCVSWHTLLSNLERQVCNSQTHELPEEAPTSEELYRFADNLTALIDPMPRAKRRRLYLNAISNNPHCVPPQSEQLASVFWPLVISTNYDDVFWSSVRYSRSHTPRVLGRSPADCHNVLASLDFCVDSILWAIQGFIGGPHSKRRESVRDRHQRKRMVDEIVLGHRQYQQVTNDAIHFRRAFAEVYRRRSLWFLGSGITESYLISLFSEIRHYYGAGRHPHFACFKEGSVEDEKLRFLESRLGIVPILYSEHDCLPYFLQEFACQARKKSSRLISKRYQMMEGCMPVEVQIVDSPLPECSDDAIIVSLGRNGEQPIPGKMAQNAMKGLERKKRSRDLVWRPIKTKPNSKCLPTTFIYDNSEDGDSRLLGVAARVQKNGEDDVRNLGVIPGTLVEGLQEAEKRAKVIHVGMIASGVGRPWHPVHPFMQMLVAVRQFVQGNSNGSARRIVLHVVDWRLRMALRANLVGVREVLYSDWVLYRVEVDNKRGAFDTFTTMSRGISTVEGVLQRCGLLPGEWNEKDKWKIDLVPSSMRGMEVDRNTLVPPSATVRLMFRPRGCRQ